MSQPIPLSQPADKHLSVLRDYAADLLSSQSLEDLAEAFTSFLARSGLQLPTRIQLEVKGNLPTDLFAAKQVNSLHGKTEHIDLQDGARIHVEWPLSAAGEESQFALELFGKRMEECISGIDFGQLMRGRQRAERVQNALIRIADLTNQRLDMRNFLAEIHAEVARIVEAKNFFIALYHAEDDSISFPYFVDQQDKNLPLPSERIPKQKIAGTATAFVIDTGKPLHGTPEFIAEQMNRTFEMVGSSSAYWMGFPLLSDTEVIGAVAVQSHDRGHVYQDSDREVLRFASQSIASALRLRQSQGALEEQVNRRTAELLQANQQLEAEIEERTRSDRVQKVLFKIAETTLSAGSSEQFYASVHSAIRELLHARNLYIAVQSADSDILEFRYYEDEYYSSPGSRPFNPKGLTEYILANQQPVLWSGERIARLKNQGEIEVRSDGPATVDFMAVPFEFGEGSRGVLVLQSYNPKLSYREEDLKLLNFVSQHISTAFDSVEADQRLKQANLELEHRVAERTKELDAANAQLRHDNLHDPLTGLPNREYFRQCLEAQLELAEQNKDHQFAVLFLDLDRFKVVNDSLGHLVGDQLLIRAASRIASCLRESDVIARFGGDEFAVLLDDIHRADIARLSAQRIIDAFKTPIEIQEQEVFTSTSIGIALNYPGADVEAILRHADTAMYRAKSQGRRGYALYDKHLHNEAVQKVELESNLRQAIEKGELTVYFQPLVDLKQGALHGFEALVRWRHPRHGLIPPDKFIPLAEENGLIVDLDWYVLDFVLNQYARWLDRHQGFDQLHLSINMSSEQFRHFEMPNRIENMIKRYQVPANYLCLELTESALVDNFQTVREVMQKIESLGISLALDDFGTGYSSLSYLHKFPLHMVKLDRGFIQHINTNWESQAIATSVQTLAEALHLQTVAEGIETYQQEQIIKQLGFNYGQGFGYASPLPPQDIPAYVREFSPELRPVLR